LPPYFKSCLKAGKRLRLEKPLQLF